MQSSKDFSRQYSKEWYKKERYIGKRAAKLLAPLGFVFPDLVTQSAAQGFVREVLRIYVEVFEEGGAYIAFNHYYTLDETLNEVVRHEDWSEKQLYPSYEDALDAGLEKALKLYIEARINFVVPPQEP